MKTVALTGAAGYLGQKMAALLEEHSAVEKIISIDHRETPGRSPSRKNKIYQADIRDRHLSRLFSENGVDTVIHLAFIVDPIRNLKEMCSINIDGTANILAAAAACGAKHIIVASSTSAFGAFPDNPAWLDEETPPRKHSGYAYACHKFEVERMLHEFIAQNSDLKVAVVRPCIVYGPRVDNYLSRFVLQWPFLIQVGRDRPQMQFVHEDDVVSYLVAIFEQEASGCFHIVGKGLISTTEIARLAGVRIVSLPARLAYPLVNLLYCLHFPGVEAPAAMLDFIRYRWTASDHRTRSMLQIEPKYSSREVIEDLLLRR